MRKVEKLGERARGMGREKIVYVQRLLKAMKRSGLLFVWFWFFVYCFFVVDGLFFRQLSFCSSVLCLVLYCPTARYYCCTSR